MEKTTAFNEDRRKDAEAHPENKKRLEPDICWVCKNLEEEKWIGESNISHCRNCHTIWGGEKTVHCVKCHRTFSTPGILEKHQSSYRDKQGELRVKCHDPAELEFYGEPQENAFGVPIWRKKASEDYKLSSLS